MVLLICPVGHLKQPGAAQYFEEQVGPIQLILEFKCPEDVLAERILHRARADDKKANIQNRLEAFKGPTTEVLKIYRGYGKVAEVDATGEKNAVALRVAHALVQRGIRIQPRGSSTQIHHY